MNRLARAVLALGVLLVGTSTLAAAGRFEPTVDYSADLVIEAEGRSLQAKVYTSGKQSRMELVEGGLRAVMLVDRGAQKLVMLHPEQKRAIELPLSGAGAPGMPQDPLHGRVDLKEEGKETIEGFACTRYQVVNQDRPQLKTRAWISDKERIPLKLEGTDEQGRSFRWRFTQLKVGKVEPSRFEVPADYQRMDLGAMPGVDPAQLQKLMEQSKERQPRQR